MDLATLLGLVGGFGVVISAMLTDSELSHFVNTPSIMVVMGGTLAVTMMRFSLKSFLGSFKVMVKTFRFSIESPQALVDRLVELAGIVRRDGLLALEGHDVDDDFLEKGLRLCVDGLEPEFVRKVLTEEKDQTVDRHTLGWNLFKSIGDAAPAMGMVGTLIGLIQMLSHMDDPKAIGPAMAVALLTTLYGAMIANMFALPIADKLAMRSSQEELNKTLIIEGVQSIQEGRNPRVMEELLMSYVPSANSGGLEF